MNQGEIGMGWKTNKKCKQKKITELCVCPLEPHNSILCRAVVSLQAENFLKMQNLVLLYKATTELLKFSMYISGEKLK
jgi:hypothetical protein